MNAISDPRLPPEGSWWACPTQRSDFNGPSDHPFPIPDTDFMDVAYFTRFTRAAQRQPDALALASTTRTLTYIETERRALALAGMLATAVAPGEAVAVLLADDLDIAVAYLACLAAGRVCLLVDTGNPEDRIRSILATAAPAAVLLADRQAVPPLPSGTRVVRLADASMTTTLTRLTPLGMDETAAVIYTSGSTGQPKGVARSQRQLLSRAHHKIHQFHVCPSDRILSAYTLTSGPGVTAMGMSLLSGAQLHVTDVGGAGLRGVLGQLRAHRISIVTSIAQMLRTLLALPAAPEAFATVRGIYSGSEATLRADVIAWRDVLPAGCAIALSYGLTEGAPLMDWFLPADLPGEDARLPIGYPTHLYEYAITDRHGMPVADGEVGELWARGALMSLGEWRHGRCVPGRLLADPLDPTRMILRTGDLVRRGADGIFTLIGRADAMVKVRGNRVVPGDLEDTLRQAPAVSEAVVVVDSAITGAELVAYVVAAPQGADRTALIRHVRARQPAYMVPNRIMFLDEMPRLPNGKVDRMRLADPAFYPMAADPDADRSRGGAV